jgi:phosphate transport system substrate-binding protein
MPGGTGSDRRTVSRRETLAAIAGVGGAALSGCVEFRSARESGSGLSGTIDIRGSSTVYPLMRSFAEEFTNDHEDVVINTTSTGSGAGFSDYFCAGTSDFNNASRAIRQPEVEQCDSNGVEYVQLTLATDAITVIVNNDADFVDCLTVDELASIWRADGAQRWSDVRSSFPDRPISRFGAADTSGTFDYFTTNVIGEDGEHTADYQATEQDNNIRSGVQGNRFAIGYLGFSYYYSNTDAVKALGIDSGDGCVTPSLETASSGEYDVLSRPLFTYVAKSALRREPVQEFARYALQRSTSEAVVADEVGYVPNSPESMGVQLDKLNQAIWEVEE